MQHIHELLSLACLNKVRSNKNISKFGVMGTYFSGRESIMARKEMIHRGQQDLGFGTIDVLTSLRIFRQHGLVDGTSLFSQEEEEEIRRTSQTTTVITTDLSRKSGYQDIPSVPGLFACEVILAAAKPVSKQGRLIHLFRYKATCKKENYSQDKKIMSAYSTARTEEVLEGLNEKLNSVCL